MPPLQVLPSPFYGKKFKIKRMWVKTLTILFILLFACNHSQAMSWYVEFGGNIGSSKTLSPLFTGTSSSSSLKSPFFAPFTLGLQLQDIAQFPQFQLGIQNRYFSGSDSSGGSYSVISTYPIMRIEIWNFMFGAGYSPFVWKNIYAKSFSSTSALLLETSFLFPITPEIDFGLNAAQERFRSPAGSGPKTIEYGAFFRLNYGFSQKNKEDRKRFKGWRYPFGRGR